MKKCIILIIGVFTSCENIKKEEEYSPFWVCNCEEKKKLELFISSSIKNANNMSDEEMEDVIQQLHTIGYKSICHQKLFIMKNVGIDWNKNKLDSCEIIPSQ